MDPFKLRQEFAKGDKVRDKGLTVPANIKRYVDISYGPFGRWNLLDVYHEHGITQCQPAIVSIHGGGWVYGDKELYQYYCMDLACRGFTVVNFTYRLAPESLFPAAVEDINAVFTWVAQHGKEYHIDPEQLFVVGDSAGGQLASQYLALLTNPEYQKLYKFQVPADQIHVRAVALNCGIYDMKNCAGSGKDEPFDLYLGINDTNRAELIEKVDTLKYLNSCFPPAFIMTSYYDFLKEHAKPMYETLTALEVPCRYKMYGEEGQKHMGHVFHLNIRLKEAKLCNDEECAFFRSIAENHMEDIP